MGVDFLGGGELQHEYPSHERYDQIAPLQNALEELHM
jgi:hypothetical protein